MGIERKYWPIWVLVVAMFFAWVAWGLVYNKMSPYESPEVALPLMYLTNFLAVMLTVFTFAVLLRLAFLPQKTVAYHTYGALRLGVNIGFTVMAIMVFLQYSIFNVWIGILLVTMAVLVEAFFLSKSER